MRTCHSPTGDLRGVGAKYDDPVDAAGPHLMPRGGRRGGAAAPPGRDVPPYLEPTAVKATVTLPRASGHRPLIRLTDFDVTIYDPAQQQLRSWLRQRRQSHASSLTDPLQAHVDMWRRWTDTDMHNMTAYLATLK